MCNCVATVHPASKKNILLHANEVNVLLLIGNSVYVDCVLSHRTDYSYLLLENNKGCELWGGWGGRQLKR